MTPLDYANAFEFLKWLVISCMSAGVAVVAWVVAGSKQRR